MSSVTCHISISLDGCVGDPTLEPVEVIASPAVTHIRYRVVR